MILRRYHPDDLQAILQLFRETVHTVNAKDYSPEQIAAWAPDDLDEIKWANLLAANYTIIAEANGVIVGFGDLTEDGEIDHLYIHKDFQSRGFAHQILHALIEKAKDNGLTAVTAAVSITALPFFIKNGAEVIKKQTVVRGGIELTNFLVHKKI